jgi:hypothetical protein
MRPAHMPHQIMKPSPKWVRLWQTRGFHQKGSLSPEAAANMRTWQHSGFSVDASVRISLADQSVPEYFQRLHLEHLLRYCVKPAFALDRHSVVPVTVHQP